MTQTILEVAVPSPLYRSFDYILDENTLADGHLHKNSHASYIKPGMRVRVSFGPQKLIGTILSIKNNSTFDAKKLKSVQAVLDDEPIFSTSMLQLLQWAADYYHHPIGEVFAAAMPALLRKGGEITTPTVRVLHPTANTATASLASNAKQQQRLLNIILEKGSLNEEQRKAAGINNSTINTLIKKSLLEYREESNTPFDISQLHTQISISPNEQQALLINDYKKQASAFKTYLLEGITGSGKTEVYLQLIEHELRHHRQALVLVPEIGLTPQTIERFQHRFNCSIAVLHSNLSDKQRLLQWQSARSGQARIIIGTRSAIFTATDNLGLIIIDEEHDLSYKQQDGFRYSAKDIACVRAKNEDIPIVLGSATPTLESLYNTEIEKFTHWQLNHRTGKAKPPEVSIVDIRNQAMVAGIAESLLADIDERLKRSEQSLIFINRRGFAPSIICHDCGWVSQCQACDAKLTIHLKARHLRCHHCGLVEPIPKQCPQCLSGDLVYQGVGTERIENELRNVFPSTPIFRVDRDTTMNTKSMPDMLNKIHANPASILIGTQMLAKGHHFPNVTLVIILDSDGALMGADYKAIERFGQLITQVIGRAGREEKPGEAKIQTHYPASEELNKLVHSGYHRFAMDILAQRHYLQLPPYSFHALIRLEDKDAQNAINTLEQIKSLLITQSKPGSASCIGPFPANLQRRANYFRYQLLIQSATRAGRKHVLNIIVDAASSIVKSHQQRWSIDVDPQDMS